MVDLYSRVVDTCLSWGFSDYEEVVEHTRLLGLFTTRISRQIDNYEHRHTVELRRKVRSLVIFNQVILFLFLMM